MGNYVLRWTAQQVAEDEDVPPPFLHIFMVAADVRYHIFDDEKNPKTNSPGRCIARLCRGNIYVCHSGRDMALWGSYINNGFTAALGYAGVSENSILPDDLKDRVFNVPSNDFNTVGIPRHSYHFTPGIVESVYKKYILGA